MGAGCLFASGHLFAQSTEDIEDNSVEQFAALQDAEPKAFEILEFGSGGKRNMLYDARQRPQSVLLHGRLYIARVRSG